MQQTSVSNLPTKENYSSNDYIITDDLTTTKKIKLENVKSGMKQEIENNLNVVVTENTVFNISGTTFKLVKKEI